MSITASNYTISCSGDLEPESLHAPENTDPVPGTTVPATRCALCKNDFDTPLNKLGNFPVCDTCKINHEKNIFPLWVKLFFAGILTIVVFSVCWNFRFYSAYLDVRRSFQANAEGDIIKASSYMTKAADRVPEASDISTLAHYYKGLKFLTQDKSKQALDEFDYCKDLDASFRVNEFVLKGEIGAAYDAKDYNLFLTTTKSALELDTTSAQNWASVSSAYACLYAVSNADSSRKLSLHYFNKARSLDSTSDAAKEYYQFIQYRLDSRQIISRDQFHKKFPNGYLKK